MGKFLTAFFDWLIGYTIRQLGSKSLLKLYDSIRDDGLITEEEEQRMLEEYKRSKDSTLPPPYGSPTDEPNPPLPLSITSSLAMSL